MEAGNDKLEHSSRALMHVNAQQMEWKILGRALDAMSRDLQSKGCYET
jgi:hypothetical protein